MCCALRFLGRMMSEGGQCGRFGEPWDLVYNGGGIGGILWALGVEWRQGCGCR